ncbi:MAG: excinuclease ABC subunit UvrA [Firmicutes bacterium]|nr:excinuclease ABC subunit UvrA [Bacillota bacterium]
MPDMITVKGAREHNLQDLNIQIPRDKLVVLTGLSGSGKSSLAFDTIFAEGQRRYMESLSSYARQFLGQMEKPDVDSIDGLSPAISIDQKSTSHNPRSTVGTVTEIYDYLRLLYARIGIPHCPNCGRVIEKQTVDQMTDQLMELPEGTRVQLLAPVVRGRKGQHVKVLDSAKRSGFVRAYIDGNLYQLDEAVELDKNIKHNIDIVVDRLVIRPGLEKRMVDSIETALKLSDGLLEADVAGEPERRLFSQNFACPDCGISIDEPQPRMFSFNNPFGACPNCTGIGYLMEFSPDLVIPDPTLSLKQGCIAAPGWMSSGNPDSFAYRILDQLSQKLHFSLDTPFQDLPDAAKNAILYGYPDEKLDIDYDGRFGDKTYHILFEGLLRNLERRYQEASDSFKAEYEEFMTNLECPVCHGKRLRKEALAVTVCDKSIADITDMSIRELTRFFEHMNLTRTEQLIASQVIKELRARTRFLNDVGLDYLTLSRSATTLSGGESQRIRLATQIGSGLTGVLYILDEPSIGLHQRDNSKLLQTLKQLRDLGNTLLVVEHDEDTMRAADHIVDIGPGAGINGGKLVVQGTLEDIMNCKESLTGAYLSGRYRIEVPNHRRVPDGRYLRVYGVRKNNLKGVDFAVPVGLFTCVTGVSGSGKSSFVNEVLYKILARRLNHARIRPDGYDEISGLQYLDKVINIDQSPIGRTPRSNPATYTGLFDLIRDMFAMTPEAKARGYAKGRFSFNIKGGRCEACSGDGIKKIEMHFLPDVYVPCEVCHGQRYNRETLEVHYHGKSISDVLDMTVEEALDFFKNLPRIREKLQTLYDVGLSYIKLGQPSTTLSGGEAQRIKLATELSRRSTGKTFYILDEPTTGLHFADVHKLIDILQKLAAGGNTVLVIEHNMDVIKSADYLIDLGPEGGDGGGHIVAVGTPEEVVKIPASYTGQFLKPYLDKASGKEARNAG